MGHRTALYDQHVAFGAKIVDFGGWDMPLHYGSQLEEHHLVRRGAGMFDVSHMTIVDVSGADAEDFLRTLLANDVTRLKTLGKALYSGMLNEQGGVIDDLIVYRLSDRFRVVVNCATREKDLAWMRAQLASFKTVLTERPELAMIAIQGPQAIDKVVSILDEAQAALVRSLKVFQGLPHGDWMFCRTGYTGEDGLEIMVPAAQASAFWAKLAHVGVSPCGLGARDTLRLEAGMNLYGQDMDDAVLPLAANMAWTVAWEPNDRRFIGRAALEQARAAGVSQELVGLLLEDKGVLRAHMRVVTEGGDGEITSGSFSPTLGKSIALARVPTGTRGECEVDMRGRRVRVQIVRPQFVRHGASVVQAL